MIKKNFKRLYSSLFIILICFNLSVSNLFSEEPKQEPISPDISKLIGELVNNPDLDLNQNLSDDEDQEDIFLSFFQQPAKMAEKLPEDYKDKVMNCWQDCQQVFLKLQHPTLFLFDIAQELGIKTEELKLNDSIQDKDINSLIDVLHKVQKFLSNQNFHAALQFGLFPEVLKKELADISEQLNLLYQKQQGGFFDEFLAEEYKEKLIILQQCFDALKTGNVAVVICYKQKCVNPEVKKIIQKLNDVQAILVELRKGVDSNDKDLIKALDFWQESFQEFDILKTLVGPGEEKTSFIKSFNSNFFYGLEKISPVILGGYAFYRKATELYKNDNKDLLSWGDALKNLTKQPEHMLFLVGDQAIRMTMIPLYFLKKFAQIRKSDINPLLQHALLQQILVELWAIHADPNFFIKTEIWPLRVLYRLAPAAGYFYMKDHLPEFKAVDDAKKRDANVLVEKYLQEDPSFRKAMWFSIKDGYKSVASFVEGELYKGIDSQSLKNCENLTFGVVKPSLISFILNTSMPLLTYKFFPEDFAKIERKDVFESEFIGENFFDYYNYVGKRDFENITDAEYIEGRILGYLALSFGSHFGKSFTSKYRRPIKVLLAKGGDYFLRGLSKIGLMSQETVDGLSEIKNNISVELKFFLNDASDPMMMMARQMFFSFLVNMGFLTQLEAADIENDINQNNLSEQDIEQITDKIIASIVDTIVIGAGGYVGSWIGWIVANWAEQKYGPFYPTLKNEFFRTKDKVSGWFDDCFAGASI